MLRDRNFIFFAFILAVAFLAHSGASAQSVDSLRQKITENNQKIAELEAQIEQYSNLLNSTSKEAQTLKNALAALELTRKKLETDLALTTRQISKTSLTLEQLAEEIDIAEKKIALGVEVIAENIRQVQMTESQSVIEELLNNKSMSDTWNYMNALNTVQERVKIEVESVRDLRIELDEKRIAAIGEKAKLESYQKNLAGQKQVVLSTQTEKDKLLKDTQNKEANYRTILAEQIKQKEAFEKELMEYESQLKIAIDPSSIPSARAGLLSWPVKNVYGTQDFGYTAAAAKLYRTTGKHGGVDLRAAIGTPIKAALSGTVSEVEAINHKSGCQYGKFVLIKHPNGLSTIYGHLSTVYVSVGDTVITDDDIGLSGNTGYATGPHLHFGLYATQGIRVVDSGTIGSARCAGIKTVAATPAAYLDPMSYLSKP